MRRRTASGLLPLALVSVALLGLGGTFAPTTSATPQTSSSSLEGSIPPLPAGEGSLAAPSACLPGCPRSINDTQPLLMVSGLVTSSSAGSNHRPVEGVDLNVSNVGGEDSVAQGVTVLFYLLSGTQHLGGVGGSPGSVVWYGFVEGVLNSSTSFAGGSVAKIGVNETYRAELTFPPGMNLTGTYQLCANATATNEPLKSYQGSGNTECITATFPHGFGFFGGVFLLIIIVPIVVVVVVVVLILRRRAKRDRAPPRRAEKTPVEPDDDDLAKLLAGTPKPPSGPSTGT